MEAVLVAYQATERIHLVGRCINRSPLFSTFCSHLTHLLLSSPPLVGQGELEVIPEHAKQIAGRMAQIEFGDYGPDIEAVPTLQKIYDLFLPVKVGASFTSPSQCTCTTQLF